MEISRERIHSLEQQLAGGSGVPVSSDLIVVVNDEPTDPNQDQTQDSQVALPANEDHSPKGPPQPDEPLQPDEEEQSLMERNHFLQQELERLRDELEKAQRVIEESKTLSVYIFLFLFYLANSQISLSGRWILLNMTIRFLYN